MGKKKLTKSEATKQRAAVTHDNRGRKTSGTSAMAIDTASGPSKVPEGMLSKSCCLPSNCPGGLLECLEPEKDILTDKDAFRFFCTNEKCGSSGRMHEKCRAKLESLAVMKLKQQPRCRTWSQQQMESNIWKDKGYSLILKLFPCNCGQGFIRKLDDEIRGATAATVPNTEVEKKAKKPKLGLDGPNHSKGGTKFMKSFSSNASHLEKSQNASCSEDVKSREKSEEISKPPYIPGLNSSNSSNNTPLKLNLDLTKLGAVPKATALHHTPVRGVPVPPRDSPLDSLTKIIPSVNYLEEIYCSSNEEDEYWEELSDSNSGIIENLMEGKIANDIEINNLQVNVNRLQSDKKVLEEKIIMEKSKSEQLTREVFQLKVSNAAKVEADKKKEQEETFAKLKSLEKQVADVAAAGDEGIKKLLDVIETLESKYESCSSKYNTLATASTELTQKIKDLQVEVCSKDEELLMLRGQLIAKDESEYAAERGPSTSKFASDDNQVAMLSLPVILKQLTAVEEEGMRTAARMTELERTIPAVVTGCRERDETITESAVDAMEFFQLLKNHQNSEYFISELEKKIVDLNSENVVLRNDFSLLETKIRWFQYELQKRKAGW